MRIALVSDGTTGRDSADLAAALSRFHHDVTVHDAPHHHWHRQDDAVAWFVEQWQEPRPAVVHSRARVAGAAAVTAAHILAIPVVHSVRSVDGPPAGTVERDIALLADRVIVSCTAELAALVVGHVPKERISVVPPGVDVEHFSPGHDHPPIGHRHRVVAVGELAPGSGFATAVAALAGLPDTELVIAGEPRNGPHAGQLREYAGRLGVADRLRIAGPVPRDAMPALLRSAHVVLATPWRPRFGITALEAAACGVAVVANDTGDLPDIVVDRVTGLLVAPRRPRALAAAVWKLLASPVLRDQYGAAARDRARTRYSWDQIAIRTLDAYRQAGATDPHPARRPRPGTLPESGPCQEFTGTGA